MIRSLFILTPALAGGTAAVAASAGCGEVLEQEIMILRAAHTPDACVTLLCVSRRHIAGTKAKSGDLRSPPD